MGGVRRPRHPYRTPLVAGRPDYHRSRGRRRVLRPAQDRGAGQGSGDAAGGPTNGSNCSKAYPAQGAVHRDEHGGRAPVSSFYGSHRREAPARNHGSRRGLLRCGWRRRCRPASGQWQPLALGYPRAGLSRLCPLPQRHASRRTHPLHRHLSRIWPRDAVLRHGCGGG